MLHRRVVRRIVVFVGVAAFGVSVAGCLPEPPPAPPTYEFDVAVHYLDGTVGPPPLGHGGVQACPPPGVAGRCAFGAADENGHARMTDADPAFVYVITGTATKMPGWSCGAWVNPETGEEYWWSSEKIGGTPGMVNGKKFVINEPRCVEFDVSVRYLDLSEGPLPSGHGSVLACWSPSSDSCRAATMDANGHGVIGLDPGGYYHFEAQAWDMPGWSCPAFEIPPMKGWVSTQQFWATPAAAHGTKFVINQPSPAGCAG